MSEQISNFQIELSVLLPALLVGMLVILTHIPLGIAVFKRGIIFIDVAIAQSAALGIVFAHQFFDNLVEDNHLIGQGFAFLAAILVAIILAFTDKKFPKFQEAIIGSTFVLSASMAIILLSVNPHGAEDFQNILAGQILWVSIKDSLWLAALYTPILIIWFCFKDRIYNVSNIAFYLLFAITITASVQIIGVYLPFSFLILPAFVASNFKSYKKQICFGYLVAMIGLVLGMTTSTILDIPTGPAISVSLVLVVVFWCWGIGIFHGNIKSVIKSKK